MKRLLPYWTWITAGILILTAGWIAITAFVIPTPSQSAKAYPRLGFLAPDFTLDDLNGEPITLSKFQGRVVVVNFWASWCPPCKSEMPAFQAVASNYPDDQVTILGVNTTYQDEMTAVNSFVVDYDLSFPILLDETGEVSHLYQIQALPTTFFIDQTGVIQKVVYGGPLSEALIRAEIDRLLEGRR